MTVEKEVTIYVESFIDAMEIVDKMDIPDLHTVIVMDEDDFEDCKCYIVINKTMFIFMPVLHLFRRPALKECARNFLNKAFGLADETNTHNCKGCKYFHTKMTENPCSSCNSEHPNFEAKEEDNDI